MLIYKSGNVALSYCNSYILPIYRKGLQLYVIQSGEPRHYR
jgi:hypothetical protein